MADKKDKKWMQKAFGKNKGLLHKKLGVKEGEKIPEKKLNKAAAKAKRTGNTKLEREVNLAKIGKKYGGGRKKK